MSADNLTILYIDDDPDDLLIFGESINSLHPNAEVLKAQGGEEGLSMLSEIEENNERFPNLIILDMNMPRMNGKQTLEAIRGRNKCADVPVVIFTTYSNHADTEFFRNFGCACITKPMSYENLTQTMKQVLSYSRTSL
ncbi:MAG: response regulator [Pseudobacter sp.]|uniref:response regulator n=1 Tax=Pseudobacter sp. TaxID=2045420 RepID=UPI003F7F3113